MKTNQSGLDRIIRAIAGIALIFLYFAGVFTGALGILSIVIGVVLLFTGAVGFCPIYAALKIKTNKA